MLHICRVYKPDYIYMYMSAEILEYHKKDNRYIYCLDKLYASLGKPYEYTLIERESLNDVQIFDYFYSEYRNIIQNIMSTMKADDKLLLNVSSGTPAMKSGLLVIATMGEYPCTAIQVVTPAKKMNEHSHEGYDVELAWECDVDNEPDYVNRCHEVKCPSLLLIKQQEMINTLVRKYDYSGALEIADSIKTAQLSSKIELIRMGQARYQLDIAAAKRIADKYNIDLFPVKSGDQQRLFEYALNLCLKVIKGDNVDFIRGLSPFIADIYEVALGKLCGIKIDDYVTYKYGVRRWDRQKLSGTRLEEVLKCKWQDFRYENIYSSQLVELILAEESLKPEIKESLSELRLIEERIRNLAAHEIVSVTDAVIQKKTGYASSQIVKLIKKTFRNVGFNYPDIYWNSYDQMNEHICNIIT